MLLCIVSMLQFCLHYSCTCLVTHQGGGQGGEPPSGSRQGGDKCLVCRAAPAAVIVQVAWLVSTPTERGSHQPLLCVCLLQPPTNKEMQLLQGRLKVPGTQQDITFGNLPAFPLKSGLKSTPQPFTRVLEFHARRASIKARSMGWAHEPVEFMTGSPYQARAKVLAWFADVDATDTDEAQPSATDVREVLQQLG